MKEKDKIRTVIGMILIATTVAGIGAWGYFAQKAGRNSQDNIMVLSIFLSMIIVVGAAIMILRQRGNLKAGLPIEDEMSRTIGYKCGSISYIASIWIACGAMTINNTYMEITLTEAVAAIVLGSGLIYFASYFYFSSRGG